MSHNTQRLFFAVTLDADTHAKVAALIEKLKIEDKDQLVRWMNPDNLHITIRFLGKTRRAVVPDLITEIEAAIKKLSPFSIQLTELELFPNHHPHIVSVKVASNPELAALAACVGAVVTAFGFPADKHHYNPHLTLGRFKKNKLPHFEKTDLKCDFLVNKVFLVDSLLKERGATHTYIKTFLLH